MLSPRALRRLLSASHHLPIISSAMTRRSPSPIGHSMHGGLQTESAAHRQQTTAMPTDTSIYWNTPSAQTRASPPCRHSLKSRNQPANSRLHINGSDQPQRSNTALKFPATLRFGTTDRGIWKKTFSP